MKRTITVDLLMQAEVDLDQYVTNYGQEDAREEIVAYVQEIVRDALTVRPLGGGGWVRISRQPEVQP